MTDNERLAPTMPIPTVGGAASPRTDRASDVSGTTGTTGMTGTAGTDAADTLHLPVAQLAQTRAFAAVDAADTTVIDVTDRRSDADTTIIATDDADDAAPTRAIDVGHDDASDDATAPAKPTAPVNPTSPTSPADPVDPVDPTEPAEPADPTPAGPAPNPFLAGGAPDVPTYTPPRDARWNDPEPEPEIIRPTGASMATIVFGLLGVLLGAVMIALGVTFPASMLQWFDADPRVVVAIGFAGVGGVLVLVAIVWSVAKMLAPRKGDKAAANGAGATDGNPRG